MKMSKIPNEEDSIIQEEEEPTDQEFDEDEDDVSGESLFDSDEMEKEE